MKVKWIKILSGFLVLVSGILGVEAQQITIAKDLPATRISLREPRSFYIEKVEDARNENKLEIGRIVANTRSQPLALSKNLAEVAFEFWKNAVGSRKETQLPVIVRIRRLNFSESRVSPGKVSGSSEIDVVFLTPKSDVLTELTSFKTRSQYTRPESQPVHDKFLEKMLTDAMVHFDKWMVVNNERNPLLAKGVRLIIKDDLTPSKPDTVFYDPKRPLRYDDFKASPRAGRYAAMVFTSISYEGASRVANGMVEVTVKLKVYLVKSMSWMRAESKNPNVLSHEQLHFDIAKISAERFKEKLRNLELSTEDHDSEIQYHFLESYREMHKMQEDYDSETRHGLNGEIQKKWENKVKSELAELLLVKRD